MKNTLIIYCHPYSGSFNHAILEKVKGTLGAAGCKYDLIDLHADGFAPFYTGPEMALFSSGGTLDPLVVKYQKKLLSADRIIIIAPIWWNSIPGMLKGFFDKVCKMNFAYVPTNFAIRGLLTHIKCATVITTSASPVWYVRFFAGNPIRGSFFATLKQLGVRRRKWIGLGMIKLISPAARSRFLEKLEKRL